MEDIKNKMIIDSIHFWINDFRKEINNNIDTFESNLISTVESYLKEDKNIDINIFS